MSRVRLCWLLAVLLPLGAQAAGALALGGAEKWKYLAFDPTTQALFIAHGTEVTVVDAEARRVIARIGGFQNAKGIAIAPNGHAYASDSKAVSVTVFDTSSFARLGSIPTGEDSNFVAYDPASRRIFAMNDDAATITAIDTATDKAVATIAIPGGEGLEAAAADGRGHLYVSHSAQGELLRIDTRHAAVDGHYKLPGCDKPQGVAVNNDADRAYVSCKSGKLVVLDTQTGRTITTLAIGPGSDTVIYDAKRHLAYTANADGTMSVIGIGAADAYVVLPSLVTGPGARTAVQDSITGVIYTVAAGKVLSLRP